jgi:hypothetical protein
MNLGDAPDPHWARICHFVEVKVDRLTDFGSGLPRFVS